MLNFSYNGIKIDAEAEMTPVKYRDGDHQRLRFERDVRVNLNFWDYNIWNGDLFETAFVKSILSHFLHENGRHSRKAEHGIKLNKTLKHDNAYRETDLALSFASRQRNGENYLHIFLEKEGHTINECYLDCMDVGLLDIAVGKAISLMTANNERPKVF
jgi:hypothetical protein